jgi:TolB-like protein
MRLALPLALLLAAPAPAAAGARVALLPLEDAAGATAARAQLGPRLAAALAARGWEVVPSAEVERVLEARRIRWLASPGRDELAAALADLGAARAVTGAVLSWRAGPRPEVALVARMVLQGGEEVWSGAVGMTGEDGAGLLGTGRTGQVEKVAARAVERLAASMPLADGRPGGRAAPSPRPLRRVAAAGRAARELAAVRGVCVLPLENESGDPVAARVVGALLERRLRADARLPVASAAAVREAMAAERIRTFRTLDPDGLRRLARRLDVGTVLTGTVYRLGEGQGRSGGLEPEVEVHLTLAGVSDGRVLWSARVARRGGDYLRLLQVGAIADRTSLADQAVAELVATLR